nr:MAG TPA: hypothetical protein [Bacteriophage sp.]
MMITLFDMLYSNYLKIFLTSIVLKKLYFEHIYFQHLLRMELSFVPN